MSTTIQTFNNAFIPAQGQYGTHARDIIPFLLANGQTLDPTQNVWCTAFVNACLTAVGYEIPDSNDPISFVSWGYTIFDQLESGDILVGGYGTMAGLVNGRIGIATGDIRLDANGQLQYRMIQGDLYGQVGYSWENWFSVTIRRPHPVPITYVSLLPSAQVRATIPSKTQTKKPVISELFAAPRPMPMASRAPVTPYDPNNSSQQKLLTGIAAPESGGRGSSATYLAYGGTDLTNAPRDSTGFPQWSGKDNSHATGIYQMQPGTWKPYADQYGLNFANAADQSAAAWYNAQAAYSGWASKNNAQYATLQDALDHGANQDVERAMVESNQWTSAKGRLANSLSNGTINTDATGTTGGGTGSGGTGTGSDGPTGGDGGTPVSASPEPASVPSGGSMPDTAQSGGKWVYGAASVQTIVSKMPTHEPWKPHPKSNVPNPPTEKLIPPNSGNSGGTNGTSNSTDQACSFGADNTTPISNTNWNAINSAATTVGVPLAAMLAVSDLVSGFDANASNTASGTMTSGLYQFSQATWDRMVQQYGFEYNISTDPTELADPVSNATMGAQSINDATVALIEMGISNPTIGQIYIMSYMGTDGGRQLIQAAQDTPDADATKMFPKNAANDPDLFDDTVSGVYNSLKKLGDSKGDAYDGQQGQAAPCDRTSDT